jgi:hypothetical protein
VRGITDPGHPIFDFRGEYDKLDESNELAGGGEIRDTGIINTGRCGGMREARWTAGGRWMGDSTKDVWKGRG